MQMRVRMTCMRRSVCQATAPRHFNAARQRSDGSFIEHDFSSDFRRRRRSCPLPPARSARPLRFSACCLMKAFAWCDGVLPFAVAQTQGFLAPSAHDFHSRLRPPMSSPSKLKTAFDRLFVECTSSGQNGTLRGGSRRPAPASPIALIGILFRLVQANHRRVPRSAARGRQTIIQPKPSALFHRRKVPSLSPVRRERQRCDLLIFCSWRTCRCPPRACLSAPRTAASKPN